MSLASPRHCIENVAKRYFLAAEYRNPQGPIRRGGASGLRSDVEGYD